MISVFLVVVNLIGSMMIFGLDGIAVAVTFVVPPSDHFDKFIIIIVDLSVVCGRFSLLIQIDFVLVFEFDSQ